MRRLSRIRGTVREAVKMSIGTHSVLCAEFEDGSHALWRNTTQLGVWEADDREAFTERFFSEVKWMDDEARRRCGAWQPIVVSNGVVHVMGLV